MRKMALIICVLSLPNISYATPLVNNVSGSFNHGNNLTITGSGFGTKSPAKPLVWADFEDGTITANLSLSANPSSLIYTGLNIESSMLPHRNSTNSVWGKSVVNGVKTASTVGALLSSEGVDKYFVFLRRRDPSGFVSKVANNKYFWALPVKVVTDAVDTRLQYHNSSCPNNPSSGRMDVQITGGTPQGLGLGLNMMAYADQWHITEVEDAKGTIDTANGVIRWWINGSLKINKKDQINRTSTHYGGYKQVESHTFWSSFKCSDGTFVGIPTSDEKHYWDDLYVDTTWARVMIGNASTFNACTHREPLIPTAWSDTSITSYFNQGSFPNGSKVYIFVIDSNGNASPGKEIAIGGTASANNPNPPQKLNIK